MDYDRALADLKAVTNFNLRWNNTTFEFQFAIGEKVCCKGANVKVLQSHTLQIYSDFSHILQIYSGFLFFFCALGKTYVAGNFDLAARMTNSNLQRLLERACVMKRCKGHFCIRAFNEA